MPLALKETLNKSRVGQRIYGDLLFRAATRHQRRGEFYPALDYLCRARRHIADAGAAVKHTRAMQSILEQLLHDEAGRLRTLGDNPLLREFGGLKEAREIRRTCAGRALEHRVRLRIPRPKDPDPTRQGNLIVLKRPDPSTGEKGVILLMFNKTFTELPAVFDLAAVCRDFRLVLEPSTTRYIEPHFFLYAGRDADHVICCTQPFDADFFRGLNMNYHPVPLGGGDWVDFDEFRPSADRRRDIDAIMVASWAPMRRHRVLFQALKRLKPRRFHVVLVGYEEVRTKEALLAEARSFGVADQLTIHESIPAAEVAALVARSKTCLLLTKFEGSNRGIHEALFCDTPIIVYRNHVGMNMNYINDQTGILADDSELPDALSWMIEHHARFRPRSWALEHTGYRFSTDLVNAQLREIAASRGEPWTRDIVPKVNRPNLRYKDDRDRIELDPVYDRLEECLNRA